MAMRAGSIGAIALAMAGCGAMPVDGSQQQQQRTWGPPDGPVEAAASCDAAAGQRFIGQEASSEIGRQLLAATGAAQLRWAPPRSALTMDYNPERLTVEFNDDRIIIHVACG